MYTKETPREFIIFLEAYCGPFIKSFIFNYGQGFVAGGALISCLDHEVPRDIDIYVPHLSPLDFREQLTRSPLGQHYSLIEHSEEGDGYEEPHFIDYVDLRFCKPPGTNTRIEMIFWPLCDPINTLAGFDIELCKIAMMGNWILEGRRTATDLSERVINLDVITNSKRTLSRIRKYEGRGYKCSDKTSAWIRSIGESAEEGHEASSSDRIKLARSPTGRVPPLRTDSRRVSTATTANYAYSGPLSSRTRRR